MNDGNQQNVSFSILHSISNKFLANGDEIESIKYLERALSVAQSSEYRSEQIQQLLRDYVNRCNRIAMNFLQLDQLEDCLQYLTKTEKYCTSNAESSSSMCIVDERIRQQLKATTWNNYGCYYRKNGQLKKALKYFDLALNIEASDNQMSSSDPATTMMNMCVILSQMKLHNQALEYGQKAIRLLNQPTYNCPSPDTLPVALHNVAVEFEFLRQYDKSRDYYMKSVTTAQQQLGDDHPTTLAMIHSCQKATKKFERRSTESERTISSSFKMPPIFSRTSSGSSTFRSMNSTRSIDKDLPTQELDHFIEIEPKKNTFVPRPPSQGTNQGRVRLTVKSKPEVPSPIFIRKSYLVFNSPRSSPSNRVTRSYEPKTSRPPTLFDEYIPYDRHATTIQRIFRGYLTRKKLREDKSIAQSYESCSQEFIRRYTPNYSPDLYSDSEEEEEEEHEEPAQNQEATYKEAILRSALASMKLDLSKLQSLLLQQENPKPG